MATFPFTVSFAYTMDETNHMADMLLPEATDLESLQLIRSAAPSSSSSTGPPGRGAAPAGGRAAGRGARLHLDLHRAGPPHRPARALQRGINRGAGGVSPLAGEGFDFSLDPSPPHDVDTIWDAICKAATAELSRGGDVHDLAWFKEHGFYTVPCRSARGTSPPPWPRWACATSCPTRSGCCASGRELGRRLHEHGIHWWDTQLTEYQACPNGTTCPGCWEQALVEASGAKPEDYPLWLLTTKSMQYHAGGNVSIR
jgi:phenylacetyl-CoA:acceptor oxidoreductase